MPDPYNPEPPKTTGSGAVLQIPILILWGHAEITSIVNEISKALYEYVHDLMSNG
jgi:hypothetical protein